MTNLQIHIDTSVHCAGCKEVIEYFRNGSVIEFGQLYYGFRGFENDAVKHFLGSGWREVGDKWFCGRCYVKAHAETARPEPEIALRRAA